MLAGPHWLTLEVKDLELWRPRLGIADARGGVHVDFGLGADDPEATAAALEESALSIESVDAGVRVRDHDGHYLTLVDT